MNRKICKSILVVGLIGLVSACASNSETKSTTQSQAEQQIIGNIPAGSPFSKITIGMSLKQVHDIIGEATDSHSYTTGKAFIPFYYGSDTNRLEELYKAQGSLTYTGSGIGGTNFKLYRVVYDENETGYNK